MATPGTIPQEHLGRWLFPRHDSAGRRLLWVASVALVYFISARLSLLLLFKPEGIAAIWPPEGIFLSAILLTRRNLRPLLIGTLCITDLVAEMLAGTTFGVSAFYAVALAGSATLGSWLLLRFLGESFDFRRVREVFCFLCLPVVLSNSLMSLVAAAATEFVPGPVSFWRSWRLWALSDGVGNLLVTPLILSCASSARAGLRNWNARRVLEAACLFIPLVVLNIFVFNRLAGSDLFLLLLPYLTFPFLLWAAWRFGVPGTSATMVALASIAVAFAETGFSGHSIFSGSALDNVVFIQVYLVVMAVPSLYLSALITERNDAEGNLRRVTRMLRTLSECNQALVRTEAEPGLLQNICRLLVEFGGYHLCWIGIVRKDEAGKLRLAVKSGFPEDRLEPARAAFEGTDLEAGPIEAAIQKGQSVLSSEIPGGAGPGRREATPFDADSFTALPLMASDHVWGVLVVHAGYSDAFNAEEVKLLEELAGDISFGVQTLNTRAERERAEEALRERNRYIETILENAPIGFAVNTIHDGKGLFVGSKFEEIYGLERNSLHSVDDYFEKVYLDPVFREEIRARIMADMASGDAGRMRWENIPITTAAGEKRFVTAINIPLMDQNLMVSTVQDVTARHQAEEALRRHAEELRARNEELTRFNKATTGRELRMIELKREVNELCREANKSPRYALDFADSETRQDG